MAPKIAASPAQATMDTDVLPGSSASLGPDGGQKARRPVPKNALSMTLCRHATAAVMIVTCCFATEGRAGSPLRVVVPILPAHASVLLVAESETYEMLGFQLGMAPDAVIGVAKAAGWKYRVRQASRPSATAYVDQIAVDAPFPTTVEFSAVTGNAVRIEVSSKTVEIVKEHDELFQAALAKWGEPPRPRVEGTPKLFEWPDRNGFHPSYRVSNWSDQSPAHVTLADEPARAANQAFLAGPSKPKSSL